MVNIEFLRSFRIFGFAIFDFTVSFLAILLLSPLLSKIFRLVKLDIPLKSWLYFTLPLSILIHIVVGNFTPMTKDFLSLNSGYLLKIIIFGLLYLGLTGIKRL